VLREKMKIRKKMRDFEGRIKLMKKTPLVDLEEMFLELYEYNLQNYIKQEKEKNPKKTRKEIIVQMYKLHDRLKNSGREVEVESL